MEEIWKRIPGYEDYEISSIGRLMSFRGKNPKLFKGSINKGGYLQYFLINKNGAKIIYSHVAVAMAFLGHKPCGHVLVIDHINDNKLDNRVENLQIVTTRFNVHKTQGNYSSQYKGVCWNKASNKWQSSIRINGKIKYLGLFTDEYEAHLVYQKALKELI